VGAEKGNGVKTEKRGPGLPLEFQKGKKDKIEVREVKTDS